MRRVFDFNEQTLPRGIIGNARELGWPCRMYRVTLPKVKHDNGNGKFNAFELCFLKMLMFGHFEPKGLAEETCMPTDLVEIILLRLYDRGLIDENYQVKPEIVAQIRQFDSDRGKETGEYGTYIIFRELISGRLLPALLEAKVRAEELADDYGNIKKNGRIVRLNHLHVMQDNNSTPTVTEFLSILRTLARRRKESRDESILMPSAEFISIASEAEPCVLRVRVVIQLSSDWRICNPFGKGWSHELEAAYQNVLEQNSQEAKGFREWQNYYRKEKTDRVQDDTGESESFDTLDNRARYPELIRTLSRHGTDVYAALEWALYYALKQHDLKKIIQILSYDTQENNQALIEKATRNLIELAVRHSLTSRCDNGLDESNNTLIFKPLSQHGDSHNQSDEKNSAGKEQDFADGEVIEDNLINDKETSLDGRIEGLCKVAGYIHTPLLGKLHSYQFEDMAEMMVVLPLAILLSQEEPDFPFINVMRAYPDTLSRIINLKTRRDERRHGKNRWEDIFGEEDRRYMRDVITTLLPRIRFSDSAQRTAPDEEAKADERFNARLALQDVFTVSGFEKMDSIQQEFLLQVEMIRQNKPIHVHNWGKQNDNRDNVFDALQGINALYAALQCFFRPLLKGAQPSSVSTETAARIVNDVGWGKLPGTLRNVRQDMIEKTLAGSDQTLGACIISWLLLSDIEMLKEIATRLPSLISTLDRFLALNKHANQACLMQDDEFDALCKDIYGIIKNIEEY